MPELNLTALEKVARLAHLKIDPNEIDSYITKLSRVMHLVEKIQNIETKDIEPMAHPLSIIEKVQNLRRDVVTEQDQHETLQENAPETESSASVYLVPTVIE